MEFLRFGSSIPGTYYGCCAVDIIQQFGVDPDSKSSIQMVDGDSGTPLGDRFAGPTYRDIFNQRLRCGTFSTRDMPNHTFFAVMTDFQISTPYGKKWLAILKEAGFEFVRTVDNSVYTGKKLLGTSETVRSSHKNYIFALFRNIGEGAVEDPFTPPKAWTELTEVIPEPYNNDGVSKVREIHTEIWNRIGGPKWLTREEVIAAGAPVVLAGKRSLFPQQREDLRKEAEERLNSSTGKVDTYTDFDPFDDDDDYSEEF